MSVLGCEIKSAGRLCIHTLPTGRLARLALLANNLALTDLEPARARRLDRWQWLKPELGQAPVSVV